MTSLKLKKGALLGLASWLNELPLSGKESRERTRFVKTLSEEITLIEDERKQIIEKYVAKEEDGKTWKKTVDNSTGEEVEVWDLSPEDKLKVTQEIVDLYQEEYVLDITESNKERMAVIKDIILNTDYTFGPKESDLAELKIAKLRQSGDYEYWCEAFEAVTIA